MSYNYEIEKAVVFTDAGQRAFLSVRDFAAQALKLAGAVRAQELMDHASGLSDSFAQMACVDRLVDLGELIEVESNAAWQYRVFRGTG